MNASAAHLARPLHRPVISELVDPTYGRLDAFQPLPEGFRIAGTPGDYLGMSVVNGEVTFVPTLFAGSGLGSCEYDELASRILFALCTQYDNQWGCISLHAFLKSIMDEYNERIETRRWESAFAAQNAQTESGRKDTQLLKLVLNGLRKHKAEVPTNTPKPARTLHRFHASPLVEHGSESPQRKVNDALLKMNGEDLIGHNSSGIYFHPTLAFTRAINDHFNPRIPS